MIWVGIACEWLLVVLITQSTSLSSIFTTAPLAPWQWLALLVCPSLILGTEEVRKALLRWQNRSF
jgi:Ca2+-transporting ATPase